MSIVEVKKKSLIEPSSSLLETHLGELEEECARFLSLISDLRAIAESESANDDDREVIEGELYACISHLCHHASPAVEEMDRLLDQMPDEK